MRRLLQTWLFVVCAAVAGVAQTDSCVINSLPRFWDFEGNNIPTSTGTNPQPLPICWSRCPLFYSNSIPNFYPFVATNEPNNALSYSGDNYLRFMFSVDNMAILPPIDTTVIQISDLLVSFFARIAGGDSHYLEIGVIEDPLNQSTFVPVDTVTLSTTYSVFDVPLNNYHGSGFYIGIRSVSSTNFICLDDLTVQMMPGCLRPTNITLTDVGLTTADLSWSHDADSTWYVVEYKPIDGDTVLYDTTAVITTPAVTLAGLFQNTTYEVRVAAGCYPDAFSEPFIFSTVCGVIDSLPRFWDFEGDNSGGDANDPLPACWTHLKTNPSYYKPFVFENANWALSGSKSLYFDYVMGCNVILPVLSDTIQTNELSLSFYLKPYTAWGSIATLDVGVMSDPTDESTFTLIQRLSNLSNDYQLYDVELSSYSGTGKYIAFRDTSFSRYFMDDLLLMRIGDCQRPRNLVLVNETGRSAVVSWTHNSDSTQYIVYHRQVGTEAWQIDTTYDTTFMFTQLTPHTSYEYYIVASCLSDIPSVTASFTTGCPHDIVSVPQTWDFEDATLNEMQPCWSRIVGNYAYYTSYPRVEQWHPYSGSQSLVFYGCEGSMAVMPYVNSEYLDIRELQISFYLYNARGDQYAGSRLEVGVMTDPTDPSTFTLVQTLDSIQKAFVYVTVPFYSYEGNGTYIAFRDPNPYYYNSLQAYYDIYIDSLTIGQNDSLPLIDTIDGVMDNTIQEMMVLLYPNPSRDYVDVRVTDPDQRILGIEVYDVYGKLVHLVETRHGTSLQTRINVSGLVNGAYFVQIHTEKGTITKKMLKAG